jgi:hypothetical protein
MQASQWKGNNGAVQTGYQMVAESVISARPYAREVGRKVSVQPTPNDDYSDDVPF